MKTPIGVVHGRFQLLHNGHLDLIVPTFENCEKVIIGICNPEPDLSAFDAANPHRSLSENNPFTFWERFEMIENALLELHFPRERFEIVPFPINFPEKIHNYVPEGATHFIDIYDEWGLKKKEDLIKAGFIVVVRKTLTLETRSKPGSEIRAMIKNNDERWREYVPNAVQKLLQEGLINKLK